MQLVGCLPIQRPQSGARAGAIDNYHARRFHFNIFFGTHPLSLSLFWMASMETGGAGRNRCKKKKKMKNCCVCVLFAYIDMPKTSQLPTKTRNRPSRITTLLAGHNGRFFFQKSDRLLLPLRAHPSIRVTRLLNRDLVIISLCVPMPSELNARFIIIGIIVAPAWAVAYLYILFFERLMV